MNEQLSVHSSPQETISPPADVELNAEEGAKILTKSFELGQGYPMQQRLVLNLAADLRPTWVVTPETIADIREVTLRKVFTFLKPHSQEELPEENRRLVHKHKEDNDIVGELNDRLADFEKTFSPQRKRREKTRSILELRDTMVTQDLTYLKSMEGRPRHNVNPDTPKGDPRFSYICYYALQGNTTGSELWDEFFQVIHEDILRTIETHYPTHLDMAVRIFELVSAYNKTHPQNSIENFIPEDYEERLTAARSKSTNV